MRQPLVFVVASFIGMASVEVVASPICRRDSSTSFQTSITGQFTRVATDHAQHMYAAWVNNGIWVAISADNGTTYGSPQQISTLADNDSNQNIDAAAVAGGGGVYVVFTHLKGTQRQLYFSASHGGGTWTPAARIPMGNENADYPSIAVAPGPGATGDRIIVTYGSGSIYAASSSDAGTTWTGGHVVIAGGTSFLQDARIGISNSRVHMAYKASTTSTPTQNSIRYARSDDLGQTFGGCVVLSQTPPEFGVEMGSLATEGLVVAVVWSDQRDGSLGGCRTGEAYLARSVDGGATFAPDRRLTSTGYCRGGCGCVGATYLTINSTGLGVLAWNDFQSSAFFMDIFAVTSSDFGANFGSEQPLIQGMSEGALVELAGGIASDGSRVALGRIEQAQYPGPINAIADAFTCQ